MYIGGKPPNANVKLPEGECRNRFAGFFAYFSIRAFVAYIDMDLMGKGQRYPMLGRTGSDHRKSCYKVLDGV